MAKDWLFLVTVQMAEGREFDEFKVELRAAAPGAWAKLAGPQHVRLGGPVHCGRLIEMFLVGKGLAYKVQTKAEPVKPVAYKCPALFRPEPEITPFEFQRDSISFAEARSGCILQLPPGAGKTLVGVHWALAGKGLTIIITRPSVLIQWSREIQKFSRATSLIIEHNTGAPARTREVWPSTDLVMAASLPGGARPTLASPCTVATLVRRSVDRSERVPVLVGLTQTGTIWRNLEEAVRCRVDPTNPTQALPWRRGDPVGVPGYALRWSDPYSGPQPTFLIIGWQMLTRYRLYLSLLAPKQVVYDEIHMAKSFKRVEAVNREDGTVSYKKKDSMTASAKVISEVCKRRLGLTATPVMDRLRDLWAQLDLVVPWEFGVFYGGFAKRYLDAHDSQWGGLDVTGCSNEEELRERMTHVVFQVPISVTHAQLPKLRRKVFYLPEEEQCDAGDFSEEYRAATPFGTNAIREVQLKESAAKKRNYAVERVVEVIQGGGKVVVFTGRKLDCDLMGAAVRKALKLHKDDPSVQVGHGDNSGTERQMMLDAFMNQKAGALIGTGDAWGMSSNIQDADLLLSIQLPQTPGDAIQREGRVYRHGMTRPVLCEYVLAENTVDDEYAEMLLEKLPTVEEITNNEEVQGFGKELAYGGDRDTVRAKAMDTILGIDADSIED